MLLVYEGVDGAGKTTALDRLAERIGAETRHYGQPKAHPLEEYVLPLDAYVPGGGAHLFIDRLHLGELIYGPLYRGASVLGDIDGPGHRYVDLYLASRGAVLVHVTAPLTVIRARLERRGEDFLQLVHLRDVRASYVAAAAASGRRVTTRRYLTTNSGRASDATLIYDAARLEAGVVDAHAVTKGRWLGVSRPDVLLVGEETSPRHLRGQRPAYAAPFAPYRDSSGWYLFGALTPAVVDACAVVNAREVDLPRAYEVLNEPRVVALGRAADTQLRHHGIAHATVPHPQHVRRFQHACAAEYGALIESVAGTQRMEIAWRCM